MELELENSKYREKRNKELILIFKKNLFEKRNQLLNESDKYMLSDYPINEINKNKVVIYRQELRDYPLLSFFLNFNGDYGEGLLLLPKLLLD